MEENTDPELNTAEVPGESIETSEVEELVHNEATPDKSPEEDTVTTSDLVNDSQIDMDKADETDSGEKQDKDGAEEHDLLKEEKIDDLKEPTETEQVDTEKTPEDTHRRKAVELNVPDESDDIKEQLHKAPTKSVLELFVLHGISEHVIHRHSKTTREGDALDNMEYDIEARFHEDFEEVSRTSGDFLVMNQEFGASPVKFYKHMEQAVEEEEQEEAEHEEVETQFTWKDRALYYEKHILLTKLIENERVVNNILQKKISIFFKKRRMYHILKESDQNVESQQKYNNKLDAYAELMEIDSRQRKTISEEIQNLKSARETKYCQLQKQFIELQQREKEIGTGLINFKTGKPIPDKVVERLIRLQKFDMDELCRMRLKFIKLKLLVAEKQEAINSIDKIDEGLYLMDFEELKIENRGLADKIEERDEELTKLRIKCQDTIQILAHIREKTSALEADIENLYEGLVVVERQGLQNRETLNTLKQERDYYRSMCLKLHEESGLLIEVELLRDMKDSTEDLQILTEKLEGLTKEHKIKTKQIRNIRRNIEYAQEGMMKKSYKNISEKSLTNPSFFKTRPSIFTPTLPKDAFRHLKRFKSKSTFVNNKQRK